MKTRRDISNQEVRDLYEKHRNQLVVAGLLECSQRLIYDVLKGFREDPIPKVKLIATKEKKICSCCGEKFVKPGNRFLCYDCYENPPIDF